MTEQNKINMLTTLFETFPLFHHWFTNSSVSDELGLTKTQEIILLSLMNHPSLSMSNLAYHIHSSKEHATRSVNTLVEMGLMERTMDQSNRRFVLVQLTSEGKEYLERRKTALTRDLIDKFNTLSEEDLSRLHRAIYDIHDIIFQLNLKNP